MGVRAFKPGSMFTNHTTPCTKAAILTRIQDIKHPKYGKLNFSVATKYA